MLNLHNSIIIAILTKTFNVQRLILSIIIVISFHFSFGQNIGKIQKELKENPKTRIQNAAKLRDHYVDFSTDSLFTLGTYLIKQGIEEDDVPVLMYGKIILSSYNNLNGKTESSIKMLKDCELYYQKRGDYERLADAQNMLGIAYIYSGDYNKAANSFVKSIKNADKLDENNEAFIAQLNLSEVYIREDKLDLAEAEVLAYIEKCKKIKAINGLKKGYDFLAKINMQRDNMDLTIYYYEKSLKLAMKDKSYMSRASAFNNIAIAHFETGKLDLSFHYFKLALDLRVKINRPKEISESYYNLGDWNFYQDRFDEALKYYQLSLGVASKNNLHREIADAYDKISMSYEAKGDYKNALQFAKKFQEEEAKNYKRNQANETDMQRTIYEMEREEQILKQKKREDKIQNKVTVEKDRGKIIVITFTIIVALMITFYFLQNARKNKQNAKLITEKEFDETASKLKLRDQKWQELEDFIQKDNHHKNSINTFEIKANVFNSIGEFQFLRLSNDNYIFWETPLSNLENYILKNYFVEAIGTKTDEKTIIQIVENQPLIDTTKLSFSFISLQDNQLFVDGKQGLLIQNSSKMSFLNENGTVITHPTILISERLKNELLATENWEKFLSQIDMLPRMSNEMALDTMYRCWKEMLEKQHLGILFFFDQRLVNLA
jgi:tetratricopeptide (TPR) repeat protein